MRRCVPSVFVAGLVACSSGSLAQTTGIFETIGGSEGADSSASGESSTTSASDTSTIDDSVDATSDTPTSDTPTSGESTSASVTETGTGESGAVETTSTTESGMLACVDDDLGSALGDGLASGNSGDGDDIAVSCASGDGEDVVYTWTAPSAGTYTFDLSGSSYDTALAIVAADCEGGELGCNDDAIGVTSSVTVDLGAGEQVLIVIDGYQGDVGSFVLDVNDALDLSCVDEDLLDATGPGVGGGSTVGDDDTLSPGCADGGSDVVLAWTAPVSATWHFSLTGSSYDTALSIWSPDCGGEELACNDDGLVDLTSELDLDVGVGQTVIIVIDGYMGATGDFTLTIE